MTAPIFDSDTPRIVGVVEMPSLDDAMRQDGLIAEDSWTSRRKSRL